uniref:Uncharacterized protein n=1 Tax=Knipowitschia caucasica TaxID=637954 RepID=A0AAV2M3U0_KNICA
MCEVMPTISEGDSAAPPRGPGGVQNGSEQEANFEQLMVNMLDERDKLLESLRETQETLIQNQTKLQGALHERDMLQRQINASLPQVRSYTQGINGCSGFNIFATVWAEAGSEDGVILSGCG